MMTYTNHFGLLLIILVSCAVAFENGESEQIRQSRQQKPQDLLKNVGSALTNSAGNLISGVQHFVVGVLSGINDVGLINQGIEPIESTTADPDEETTPQEEETTPFRPRPPFPQTLGVPITTTSTRPRRTRSTTPLPIAVTQPPNVHILPEGSLEPSPAPALVPSIPFIHPDFPQYQLVALPIQPQFQESAQPSPSGVSVNSNGPQTIIAADPLKFKLKRPIPTSNLAPVQVIVQPQQHQVDLGGQRPGKYTIRRKNTTPLPDALEGGFNIVKLGPVVRVPGQPETPKDNSGFISNKEDHGYPVPVDVRPSFSNFRPDQGGYPELVEVKSGPNEGPEGPDEGEVTTEETETETPEPEARAKSFFKIPK